MARISPRVLQKPALRGAAEVQLGYTGHRHLTDTETSPDPTELCQPIRTVPCQERVREFVWQSAVFPVHKQPPAEVSASQTPQRQAEQGMEET